MQLKLWLHSFSLGYKILLSFVIITLEQYFRLVSNFVFAIATNIRVGQKC
jgi:hypothetical protein